MAKSKPRERINAVHPLNQFERDYTIRKLRLGWTLKDALEALPRNQGKTHRQINYCYHLTMLKYVTFNKSVQALSPAVRGQKSCRSRTPKGAQYGDVLFNEHTHPGWSAAQTLGQNIMAKAEPQESAFRADLYNGRLANLILDIFEFNDELARIQKIMKDIQKKKIRQPWRPWWWKR